MTLHEFKAWFDGFTENIGEAGPSLAQWERIKTRVSEIDWRPAVLQPQSPPLWWQSNNTAARGPDFQGYSTIQIGSGEIMTVPPLMGEAASRN